MTRDEQVWDELIVDNGTTHITVATPKGWKCDRCPADYLHTHTTYTMFNEKGHLYRLENEGEGSQELRFVKKEKGAQGDGLVITHNGTTTEAVIEALVDRLSYLHEQLPDDFTARAIQSLTDARTALEERTADRQAREVEGADKA